MSDEPLKPALPPAYWERLSGGIAYLRAWDDHVHAVEHRKSGIPGARSVAVSAKNETEALLALANAALPDGSAYKITRADVQALREVISCLADIGKYTDDVEQLAAKLAALLPPE